jgi:GNAT superfamily N-acetyltransferase
MSSAAAADESPVLALSIRALTADEVPVWSAFVGTRGFAHRSGDPGRFLARFVADATASHTRVLVATLVDDAAAAAPRLVGSMRLIERTVMLPGGARARVIGWADVCSDPELRGRGIVGTVLAEARTRTDALAEEWEARDGTPVFALLHAAEAVRGLYEKFGFVRGRLDVAYARVRVNADAGIEARAVAGGVGAGARPLIGGSAGLTVARADFGALWRELDALRTSTVARCALVGTIVRDASYWSRWLPVTAATALELRGDDGALRAFGAVVARDGLLRVVDWARASELDPRDARIFLRECARVASAAALADDATVAMPLVLARDALGAAESADSTVSDSGWMLCALGRGGNEVSDALAAAAANGTFLVLVADSF